MVGKSAQEMKDIEVAYKKMNMEALITEKHGGCRNDRLRQKNI